MKTDNFITSTNTKTSFVAVQSDNFVLRTGVLSVAFDCIIHSHNSYWFYYCRDSIGLVVFESEADVLELARQQGVRIIEAAEDE